MFDVIQKVVLLELRNASGGFSFIVQTIVGCDEIQQQENRDIVLNCSWLMGFSSVIVYICYRLFVILQQTLWKKGWHIQNCLCVCIFLHYKNQQVCSDFDQTLKSVIIDNRQPFVIFKFTYILDSAWSPKSKTLSWPDIRLYQQYETHNDHWLYSLKKLKRGVKGHDLIRPTKPFSKARIIH